MENKEVGNKDAGNQKHYVTYLFPGVFMPETSTEEVKDRNPDNIKPPDNCFCFYFFDRTEIVQKKETLYGKDKNHSGRFYIGGKLYSLIELKKDFPDMTTLATNMECNNWKKVIRCFTGNWQPFEKIDTLLKKEA